MSVRACGRCGRTPPDGYASVTVGGVTSWYCHPDDGPDCYSDNEHDATFGMLERYR